jgi:hypothetical protein
MMGNHYLLNHSASWAAVCISKNGCTSLKTRILMDHGIPATDFATIHDRIGYDSKSRFLRPVSAGLPKGFHVFAVWRDPVARFLSVFKRFALAGDSGRHPESLPPEIDAWLDWVEDELHKPILRQDEHIRRQSDYYRPDDVDAIVPLDHLGNWFALNGYGELPHEHQRPVAVDLTPAQAARIRRIYWQDYVELGSLLPAWDDKPLVAGLWIGDELPPSARRCVLSLLHDGFRFRLHTYGEVAGVPDGVEEANAAELLPAQELHAQSPACLAQALDRIRSRYLARTGGFWADLAMVRLNPAEFIKKHPWFPLPADEWSDADGC